MTEEQFEAVRARACEIWDREHRPQGQNEAHWAQALAELGLDPFPRDVARETIAAQAREWDASEEDQ